MTWGVDIDGVLRDWATSFNNEYVKQFPEFKDCITPMTSWDWFDKYHWKDVPSREWLRENNSKILENAAMYFGVKEIFDLLGYCAYRYDYKLKIITRQPCERDFNITKEWLLKKELFADEVINVQDFSGKWEHADVMIEDAPQVLDVKPERCISIKVNYVYNQESLSDFSINSFSEMNEDFIRKIVDIYKSKF
jgi:hypothetical protein